MRRAVLAGIVVTALVGASIASAKATKGDPAKGKKTYETYCFTCHGMGGKGDGAAAGGLKDSTGKSVKPADHTNFAYMSKLTDEHIFKTIKLGGKAVGKSDAMAAWGSALKDAEIWDVVAYVRTLAVKPKK